MALQSRALCGAALAGAIAACSGSGGTPDRELTGLVTAAAAPTAAAPAEAGKDPAQLASALARPHHVAGAALGAHRLVVRSKIEVVDGNRVVEQVADDTTVDYDAGGQYHATSTNSADYGREVFYVGGELYLRPRYSRWHRRKPNDDAEAGQLLDEIASVLPSYYDLLAAGADVADQGAVQQAGRAARRIQIKPTKSPRKPPAQPLVQRKWRESATVEAVAGEVVLDAETGVALTAKLAGQVAFSRDGRRFIMTIDVAQEVTPLAQPPSFTLPAPEEVVATPERLHEVDERDFLLEGMAPPARRDKDKETP